MKKVVNTMLSLNVWFLFFLLVASAVALSVLLAAVLNSLFYDGSNNLIFLGAVVIPLVDAPIIIILLITMIRELRDSRQQLDKRVKERTAELEISNDKLMQEIANREKIQAQLIQAQKMESVGRLAGGVAHDYNNMLSVIIGYTEMALEKTDPSDKLHENLQEVLNAAMRSADITQQLLAFARKQTVEPKVFDLNEVVERLLKMLLRLIGENIDLTLLPKKGLWQIKMDPSQINMVLVNLCVNARDAITDVGKITIETDNVSFDETYCAEHVRFIPGEFVLLSVSDNGSGIDKKILEHLFEPFFTTKGMGKGTGLGLATVYGIVKQNNGFIIVDSEQGKGTTFRLYLPRHEGRPSVPNVENEALSPEGSGETLLIVEDDQAIREMVREMLENIGYQVLAAGTPSEAILLAEKYADGIDLLVTDVVMPEMNGRDLAVHLQTFCPGLKTLFMSGYTDNMIVNCGVLEEGVNFLQKPFSQKELAVSVSKALGRGTAI